MPKVTTQQAAALTGKGRTTIWRAVKTGRLSAERTETGDFLIDPAELERVYGQLERGDRPRATQKGPNATTENVLETEQLRVKVELLYERVAGLEADKADLRTERDRLLGVIADQTKLLTHQPQPGARRGRLSEGLVPTMRRWLFGGDREKSSAG